MIYFRETLFVWFTESKIHIFHAYHQTLLTLTSSTRSGFPFIRGSWERQTEIQIIGSDSDLDTGDK